MEPQDLDDAAYEREERQANQLRVGGVVCFEGTEPEMQKVCGKDKR